MCKGFIAEIARDIKDLLKLAEHVLGDMKAEYPKPNKTVLKQIHEVEYTIYVLVDAISKLEKMDLNAPWFLSMIAEEVIA